MKKTRSKTVDEQVLLKKEHSNLTKLEREKVLEHELGQMEEELNATGQESEDGAVPWVIEVNRTVEQKDQKVRDDQAEFFEDKAKGSFRTYTYLLAKLTFNMLHYHVEIPADGYTFFVGYSEKDGISVTLYTPYGKYARGFKPCNERKYDLNAVNVLIMQVENTVEELENKHHKVVDTANQPVIYDLNGKELHADNQAGIDQRDHPLAKVD